MRPRLLIALSLLAALLVGAAGALAAWGSGPSHRGGDEVAVRVADLGRGRVEAVSVRRPDPSARRAKVFLRRGQARGT